MSCAEFNQRVLAACTGGDTVFAGPDCTRAVLRDVAAAQRCIHGENDLNWPPFSHYLCQSSRDRALDVVCDPSPGGQRAAPPAVPAAPGADGWTLGPVGVAGTATVALAAGALGQAARAKAKQSNTRNAFSLPEDPRGELGKYDNPMHQQTGRGSLRQDVHEIPLHQQTVRGSLRQDVQEIPAALKPQFEKLQKATQKADQRALDLTAKRNMLEIIAGREAVEKLAADVLQNLALSDGKATAIPLRKEVLINMRSRYPHFSDATLTVTLNPHDSGSDSQQADLARTDSRHTDRERQLASRSHGRETAHPHDSYPKPPGALYGEVPP